VDGENSKSKNPEVVEVNMETNIVRRVAAEMLNTSMQEITAEVIYVWATRLGDAATCKESRQVGNAAKMREALTKISKSSTYALKYRHKGLDYRDLQGYIEEMGEDARSALSAPPRNCDLYATRSDAWVAFRKKNQQAWYEDLHLSFPDWLFAEAKGENK
jgi:hypothetical protein